MPLTPRPRTLVATALAACAVVGVASVPASASPPAFGHVGTFDVPSNLAPGEPATTVTAAEIADVTLDGGLLVYTDSPLGRLGFVDIRRADRPRPLGTLDMGGEPTSVAALGRQALVAVNTSADPDGGGPLNGFDTPSGDLVVVDVLSHTVLRRVPLAGQPDSIAISPDRRWAAIVIENERDEEENDGLIPQLPAGTLQVVDLRALAKGRPDAAVLRTVDLRGLADVAPDDPEPEFVDINRRNRAVVSLQENNHLVIVDLERARVVRDFPAGSATLEGVDATEEELGPQGAGLIELTETITRRREPDAVHWIDDDTFATANEGDYADADGVEGGSRGFTLFHDDGTVEFESGASLEQEVARAGQFPQARAANKGIEPEGLEVATFDGRRLLFVGAERANVVGVYDVSRRTPRFLALLPTAIGPEGLRAIPERDMLAVPSETDGAAEGFAIRSAVTLYRIGRGPGYPQIESADDATGRPIPWTALSGLSGDPTDGRALWAVSDSALAQAYIYKIDVGPEPARITRRIPVGGVGVADQGTGDFDLEGIAARAEGGFWLASEGRTNAGSSRPNLIVRTDAAGAILDSVPLPPALVAGATSSGFEGVTVTGTQAGGDETVWVVLQREWADDAPRHVKLGRYDVAAGTWTFAAYPLDAVASPSGGWVGLSEITLLPDGHHVAIVERDDRIAGDARIKRLYGVDLTDPAVTWRAAGQPRDTVRKTLLRDVLEDLDDASISVPDKLEGAGVTARGRLFLATDNDGVDENYGETLFLDLGRVGRALDG